MLGHEKYCEAQDPRHKDYLGPVSDDENCIRLSEEVKVSMVSQESDIKLMMTELMKSDFIGIDSEGRSQIMKSSTQ